MSPREINQCSIVEYLANLGINPARKCNGYFMYYSPFRPNEKSPSMKVSSTNLWVDYGDNNCGGTLIDLILKLNPHYSVKQIVQDYNCGVFSFHQPIINREINKGFNHRIKKVQPLQNPILIEYLKLRALDISLCKSYCAEIYYEVNDKNYFGISFKNASSGYEVRNKYAKVCLGKKDVTRMLNGTKSCMIFESWSDFIAFLMLYPKVKSSNDFIVLNSTMMVSRIINELSHYKTIFCALDNDESGMMATKHIQEKFPEQVVSLNHLYTDFKDVNDLLQSI